MLGALLSSVNPKNLVLAVGAATGLAQLGLATADAVVALVVFVVLARLTIAGPVVYYLVGGAHAKTQLDELPEPGMLETLLDTTADELSSRPRREGFLGEDLSEAELRVLRELASGASIGEVARSLYLSQNTVKTHRRSIYRKLGVSTREELLARTAELDLVE